MTNDIDTPAGFETDIKPMFRERDLKAMQSRFDLSSHDDVSRHADAILARLRDGTMPCDGAGRLHRSTSSNAGSRAESSREH